MRKQKRLTKFNNKNNDKINLHKAVLNQWSFKELIDSRQ